MGYDENHYTVHKAQSLPTFLAFAWIELSEMQRVIKDKFRPFKADLVLGKVAAVLLWVPIGPHRLKYTYKSVCILRYTFEQVKRYTYIYVSTNGVVLNARTSLRESTAKKAGAKSRRVLQGFPGVRAGVT
jgi:hypothetical protein